MKQFNLNEYLKNPSRKIVTRDGHAVRILCTNKLGEFPIVALIRDGGNEIVDIFTKDGDPSGYTHCSNNLFFVPEKKIYPFKVGDRVLVRDSDTSWNFDYFDSYREGSFYPYMCRYAPHEQCIPLNEHTWKLLGTTVEYKEEE